MPETPTPFDEPDRRRIRRVLSSMPYSGSVDPASGNVRDVDSLVAWLEGLRGQLEYASTQRDELEQRAAAAERVIAAGRTFLGGVGPQPTPPEIDAAIRFAVADQGHYGATINDVEHWIRCNRTWPLVTNARIAGRLNELETAGTMHSSTGPTWTRWHLRTETAPRRAAATSLLAERVVEALAYHGDRGATLPEVITWVANTHGGALLDEDAVATYLYVMGTVGDAHIIDGSDPSRWALGLVEQCVECETTGQNCLAHRTDSVGRIARGTTFGPGEQP